MGACAFINQSARGSCCAKAGVPVSEIQNCAKNDKQRSVAAPNGHLLAAKSKRIRRPNVRSRARKQGSDRKCGDGCCVGPSASSFDVHDCSDPFSLRYDAIEMYPAVSEKTDTCVSLRIPGLEAVLEVVLLPIRVSRSDLRLPSSVGVEPVADWAARVRSVADA